MHMFCLLIRENLAGNVYLTSKPYSTHTFLFADFNKAHYTKSSNFVINFQEDVYCNQLGTKNLCYLQVLIQSTEPVFRMPVLFFIRVWSASVSVRFLSVSLCALHYDLQDYCRYLKISSYDLS